MDDVLTIDELNRMLGAARERGHGNGKPYRHAERDELILRAIAFAGLRVSELLDLRREAIQGDLVRVTHKGEPRALRLPSELAQELRAVLSRDSGHGFDLTPQAVRDLVSEYARRAGIRRRVSPATLRHTFAQAAVGTWCQTLSDLARHMGVEPATAASYLSSDLIGGPRFIEEHTSSEGTYGE